MTDACNLGEVLGAVVTALKVVGVITLVLVAGTAITRAGARR